MSVLRGLVAEPVFALEPWLGKQRLAEYFDCSVRSIELAISEGMPHAVAFGRVKAKPSEVEAWLERTGRLLRRGFDEAA